MNVPTTLGHPRNETKDRIVSTIHCTQCDQPFDVYVYLRGRPYKAKPQVCVVCTEKRWRAEQAARGPR